MYNLKTPIVLKYLGYDVEVDFSCAINNGAVDLSWLHTDPKPTEQQILYALLPALKAQKKASVRQEAQTIILAKWPLWKQNNCAMGVYPAAVATQCSDDIANVVEASNIAEASIDAATTEAELEAVSASWPVI